MDGLGENIDISGGFLANFTSYGLVIAALWVIGGWLVRRGFSVLAESDWAHDKPSIRVWQYFMTAIVLFWTSALALSSLGVSESILTSIYSMAALGISWSARESIGSWLAGATMLAARSFQPGNVIDVIDLGIRGKITAMGGMNITLEGRLGDVHIIPNLVLRNSTIRNFSDSPDGVRFRVPLDGGTDITAAMKIIRDTCEVFEYRAQGRPAIVFIDEFGANCTYIGVISFIDDVLLADVHGGRLRNDIRLAVDEYNSKQGKTTVSIGETGNLSLLPPTDGDLNIIRVESSSASQGERS